MREILFRGKAVDNGEFLKCKGKWVEGGISFFNDKTPYICPERFSDYNEEIEVDPETVSEFTGVWEKNGKKSKRIFEGDIVAVPCDRRGNEYIGVVEFGEIPNGDDRYTGFYIKWNNPDIVGSVRCSLLWWRETKDRYLKVIGNKWDNPELLKGGAA